MRRFVLTEIMGRRIHGTRYWVYCTAYRIPGRRINIVVVVFLPPLRIQASVHSACSLLQLPSFTLALFVQGGQNLGLLQSLYGYRYAFVTGILPSSSSSTLVYCYVVIALLFALHVMSSSSPPTLHFAALFFALLSFSFRFSCTVSLILDVPH